MPRKKNAKRKQPAKPIRKYQRKQRAKSRMPFVEQKHKDELLTRQSMFPAAGDVSYVYIPQVFTDMVQGDAMDEINGRWIYSKWITTRMTLSYDRMVDYNFPFKLRCRYGWCKLNLNPSGEVAGTSNLSIELGDLQAHVKRVLENNFNDTTLLPQKARDILVIKDFMLQSNPRILEDSSSGDIVSYREDKSLTMKWSPQRKIQYQKCQNIANTTFFQCCQKNWIPFVHFSRVATGSVTAPSDRDWETISW